MKPDFDPNTGPPGNGRVPNEYGRAAVSAIDRGLKASPKDIWLAHLKIHYNEMG